MRRFISAINTLASTLQGIIQSYSIVTRTTIMQKLYQPRMFIDAAEVCKNKPYAVVILNRPIALDKHLVMTIWNEAKKRVLVDGGTNRWMHFCEHLSDSERASLAQPHMITGDFDSVSDETLAKFDSKVTQVIRTPDQDETDFTKALKKLEPFIESEKIECIVAFVDNAGRIDHTMANINSMCKALGFMPSGMKLYLLCADSLSWLLPPGEHRIEVPADLVAQQRWCSFMPLDGKAMVSTTGFKWNLENHPVQFGGMVSTSNTYECEILTLHTDRMLYFAMGIGRFMDDPHC